jgi:uncharacterized protein
MSKEPDYEKLLLHLKENVVWPSVYLFKFIIEEDEAKAILIQSKFGKKDEISLKKSSNGKYTSISVKSMMPSAEAVIDKYKEFKGIEGIISL